MSSLQSKRDERGVLTLTLDRPEVHNAFDDGLIARLTEALAAADQDAGVRVVVLTGAGASFSAGADLNWMRRMADASAEENEQDALRLAGLLRALNYLRHPTVARINGAAFGGGLGLVACCDIAVAADTARFGLTEARLGLAPAVISPYVFRVLGERNARRYFMTGERFGAGRARQMGLVQDTVPETGLDAAVTVVVGQLLESGPEATRINKRLALAIAGHGRDKQRALDEYTARLIAELRVSAEGREGMAAFLEKRRPAWAG